MSAEYGNSVMLAADLEQAEERVREALAANGFGVLTEIDVAATLEAKLGVERTPYKILGACNPELAHEALGIDEGLGLLLPCNVVLAARAEGTEVMAIDPGAMMAVADNPAIEPVAARAAELLGKALASL